MPDRFRKSVFIVTYAFNKNEIYYLIMKRKLHWVGWEFPKGGIEKNENSFGAVKRELREETSSVPIKIKKFNFRGKYRYRKKILGRENAIGQSFVLFSAEIKFQKIKFDEMEHSGYEWLPSNKAMKKLTHRNQKKCLEIVNKWLTNKKDIFKNS